MAGFPSADPQNRKSRTLRQVADAVLAAVRRLIEFDCRFQLYRYNLYNLGEIANDLDRLIYVTARGAGLS